MKIKDAQFFAVVSSFLNVYLVKNRSCSPNTVKSYEEALNLFFTFLETTKAIPRQRVSWSHFTRQNIQEFVDWLEKVRNCSRQTQLQRLAAIFGISLVILNFGITKLSALPVHAKDSEIQEALSSLSLPAWLKPGTLRICCLKTYPACCLMTAAGRLQRSSIHWTDWGMVWNGNVSTAKILQSRNPGIGCTLSDILMPDVEERYFLSPKQQEQLLYKNAAVTKVSASTPPKG